MRVRKKQIRILRISKAENSDMESHKTESSSADNTTKAADSLPALKLLCSICSEFFRGRDRICSINTCGHVFHQNCLRRWLKRSTTCPQCRASCHWQLVSRLHLNFGAVTELCDKESTEAESHETDAPFQWVPMNLNGDTSTEDSYLPPEGALQCAVSDRGNPSYVARTYLEYDRLPAHYVPTEKVAHGGWNGKVYTFTEGVEVLVLKDCDYEWVAGRHGSYPENALPTGYARWDEVTYTGRGVCNTTMRLGKVHPSYRALFIPIWSREFGVSSYEVLVLTPRNQPDQ
ncbi:uncharacterized protein LOC108036191 [Drosophila biarmipes]|uniref:uncharacterized protein LOC108036191 n=1 Tax=Drosophila biarmipes TaxID=125945 RepID=UPI0007E79D81|nr:uncharacterized protein LOC108036191 [Drosophila biarmipes]